MRTHIRFVSSYPYICDHTDWSKCSRRSLLIYVSSYPFVCVLMLYMCPHTPTYEHCSRCLFLYCQSAPASLYMCPHTLLYVSSCYICVLILLRMSIARAASFARVLQVYVSSYCHICVLILLYTCPHAATRVLIPYPYVSSYSIRMCPHTLSVCVLIRYPYVSSYSRATRCLAIYVSSYPCICVLILLYTRPHTATRVLIILYLYVSSYSIRMSPHTLEPRAAFSQSSLNVG
jgi:hypothetical protein